MATLLGIVLVSVLSLAVLVLWVRMAHKVASVVHESKRSESSGYHAGDVTAMLLRSDGSVEKRTWGRDSVCEIPDLSDTY